MSWKDWLRAIADGVGLLLLMILLWLAIVVAEALFFNVQL